MNWSKFEKNEMNFMLSFLLNIDISLPTKIQLKLQVIGIFA